jgi:hypothetical protein
MRIFRGKHAISTYGSDRLVPDTNVQFEWICNIGDDKMGVRTNKNAWTCRNGDGNA